jgi:hypothetical protein
MWPWVLLGSVILIAVGLSSWMIQRSLTHRLDRHHLQVMLAFDGAANQVAMAIKELQTLRQEMEKPLPEEHWLGSFLPDDALAADLERQARLAEDRSLSASDRRRFSSRPSPTLANPSRRVPSTQRVPSSGKG